MGKKRTPKLGDVVEVYWPIDEKWYRGELQKRTRANGRFVVGYEDGECETLDLRKEKWRFVNASALWADGGETFGSESDSLKGGSRNVHEGNEVNDKKEENVEKTDDDDDKDMNEHEENKQELLPHMDVESKGETSARKGPRSASKIARGVCVSVRGDTKTTLRKPPWIATPSRVVIAKGPQSTTKCRGNAGDFTARQAGSGLSNEKMNVSEEEPWTVSAGSSTKRRGPSTGHRVMKRRRGGTLANTCNALATLDRSITQTTKVVRLPSYTDWKTIEELGGFGERVLKILRQGETTCLRDTLCGAVDTLEKALNMRVSRAKAHHAAVAEQLSAARLAARVTLNKVACDLEDAAVARVKNSVRPAAVSAIAEALAGPVASAIAYSTLDSTAIELSVNLAISRLVSHAVPSSAPNLLRNAPKRFSSTK